MSFQKPRMFRDVLAEPMIDGVGAVAQDILGQEICSCSKPSKASPWQCKVDVFANFELPPSLIKKVVCSAQGVVDCSHHIVKQLIGFLIVVTLAYEFKWLRTA
eukprot:TRINITY_DN25654_c0_g1_i1.p1 TRINITY_DN25654_c0_g1~~TRINITY_DN25654_c0_g1_i1.p1  ORF type:complete len:103 (+),score=11.95 TRINITY_DN25654_c0_g1_i1:42-350(+)